MNDIKVLLKIFKRYKAKIIVLWIVDLFSVIAQTFLPIIIGLTIDNLLDKQSIFTSILPLIMLELFIMILQFTSEKYDDKTYDKILENEKGLYFKYALEREYDNTVISERIDEVDNVVDLFHTQLPNLAGNIAWMVGSVIYLITCTPPFVVVMSSISAIVVSTLSKKKIIDKYASLKEICELEQEKLLTKNYKEYKEYLALLYEKDIELSNDYATLGFRFNFIQLIFLAVSLFMLLTTKDISYGFIYTAVTYIYQLNNEVKDYNYNYIFMKDTFNSLKRLEWNSWNKN